MSAPVRRPAPSCATCRFFVLNPHPAEFGACHRYAPRPADSSVPCVAVWPGVLGTDHCGEYVPDHGRQRVVGTLSVRLER